MGKQVVGLAGNENIGKSGFLLLMAEANPTMTAFILDTQNRMKKVAEGVTENGELPPNVHLGVIDEVMDDEETKLHPMEQALNWMNKEVKPAIVGKPGTFIYGVDMVGKIWEWAQDYWPYTHGGKRQADIEPKVGKTNFTVGIDDQHSWQRIKGWHNTLTYNMINSPKFDNTHCFFTTGVRDMRKDSKNPIADKDPDMLGMWQQFGNVLPDCEKHLTYEVYTMLAQSFMLDSKFQRKHHLTLVKEMKRGRSDVVELFRKAPIEVDEDGMWDTWGTYCALRREGVTALDDLG